MEVTDGDGETCYVAVEISFTAKRSEELPQGRPDHGGHGRRRGDLLRGCGDIVHANGRDTTRAVRNAEFLTRFTGKRSQAAVAGLRRDDRIEDSIESGEVFWYQLDRSDLEAE